MFGLTTGSANFSVRSLLGGCPFQSLVMVPERSHERLLPQGNLERLAMNLRHFAKSPVLVHWMQGIVDLNFWRLFLIRGVMISHLLLTFCDKTYNVISRTTAALPVSSTVRVSWRAHDMSRDGSHERTERVRFGSSPKDMCSMATPIHGTKQTECSRGHWA